MSASRTSKATKRAAETFAWLRLLNGDRDPMALAVGVILLDHFNPKEGGQARPGCASMAAKLGVAESTVIRAIRRMVERGRLNVIWGSPGRGHPNRYWMVVKPAPAQVSEPRKPARRKPAPEENKTCASAGEPLKRTIEGDREVLHTSPIPVERENALTRENSLPIMGAARGASPDLFEDHHQADPPQNSPSAEPAARPKSPAAGSRQGENSNRDELTAGVASFAEERHWRELREIWERGHPSDDAPRSVAVARIAFARACVAAEGGAEAILAGARVWRAAAEKTDGPAFLPRLAVWLSTKAWAKPPPPAKAKRDRRVGGRAERSRYDKPSIASRLLAIAEREA